MKKTRVKSKFTPNLFQINTDGCYGASDYDGCYGAGGYPGYYSGYGRGRGSGNGESSHWSSQISYELLWSGAGFAHGDSPGFGLIRASGSGCGDGLADDGTKGYTDGWRSDTTGGDWWIYHEPDVIRSPFIIDNSSGIFLLRYKGDYEN